MRAVGVKYIAIESAVSIAGLALLTAEIDDRTLVTTVKRPRLLLGLTALWEFVRFILLYLLVETGLSGEPSASAPFLLWFGAPQLIVGVGLTAEALFPGRYSGVLPLALLAKVTSSVMGFLNILVGSLPGPGFGAGIGALLVSLAPIVILVLDLGMILMLAGMTLSRTRGEEA